MGQGFGLEMAPQLAAQASPALIAFAEMLTLSSSAIDVLVDHELDENPALERFEAPGCPMCHSLGRRCVFCGNLVFEPKRHLAAGHQDTIDMVAAEPSGADELLADLRVILECSDSGIANYIVGCLDEHGFIEQSFEEIAAHLGVRPARVAGVISAVRRVAPPGVGARDLRESLLIQLAQLNGTEPEADLAARIVGCHLEDLGRGRYASIARSLNTDVTSVLAARDFIKERLRPYPAYSGTTPSPWNISPYVMPEVAIVNDVNRPGQFLVEVLESKRFELSVYSGFKQPNESLTPQESDYVKALRERAESFVTRG